ncbi:DNA adenine methylase [Phreatobacter sp.]|uniref:DNA adenine methylase n=1 Tax=Phreatobacter sp. TaxID=1966341 RepID=UPI003F6EE6A8
MTGSAARASHHISPLRYPGGKAKLARFFKKLIRENKLLDCVYVEPFAGGGGVGLSLLMHGYVDRIVLNDLSAPIFAFWQAVLQEPERFLHMIATVPLTVEEWSRQRSIFQNPAGSDPFYIGFSSFYLNRTNHSGVLNAGMIGGKSQTSSYGLDARFNRDELVARVKRISAVRDQISIQNLDAIALISDIERVAGSERQFIYIDPPYYRKGRDLYYDFYQPKDHENLSRAVSSMNTQIPWVVSYDNEPEITRLYARYRKIEYDLNYSVRNGRSGREVMFFADVVSTDWKFVADAA